MEEVHKYDCRFCGLYVFGATAATLAYALNQHNLKLHPMECTNWNANGIVLSVHYSCPTGDILSADGQERMQNYRPPPKVLPQYTTPFGTNPLSAAAQAAEKKELWGDALYAPIITDADRKMLKAGKVIWD